MISLWAGFAVSAGFVVAAGIGVGRLSNELGERLKLGRAWAGAVLLSLATTLPELVTTLSLAMRGEIGMAVGGVIGSVVFNLTILILADLVDPKPIYDRLSFQHLGTGLLGCVLLGLWTTGFSAGLSPALGGVSVQSMLWLVPVSVAAAYAVGQYVLFQIARQNAEESTPVRNPSFFDRFSTGTLLLFYAGLGCVILVAAHRLGVSAEGISNAYGWGKTFAGATLLGVVTSLPEITNAIDCSRRKEFDLAIGNVLGANVVVLVVLALAAFLVSPGRFFTALPADEALSGIAMAGVALAMQGTALGALAIHSRHRFWRLGIASIILALFYGASLILSYQLGTTG